MNSKSRVLNLAYMNIHGQSKLPTNKQLQIETFIKENRIDILHMQEIDTEPESFYNCEFISSSFNLISNNSPTRYGTASLIGSDLIFENVRCDNSGRGIVFNIGNSTFGNFYCHSGSDGQSRANRESFCAETIPNLMCNSKESGCVGGDFNMIINKEDATAHQQAKISPTFQRVVRTFKWVDSYRVLYPNTKQFSRYFGNSRGEGATRIDRCYHYGEIKVKNAVYIPLAFSDHHAHVVTIELPDDFARLLCPPVKPSFRIKTEVVNDELFQHQLAEAMTTWQNIRSFGLQVLPWWENIVKPGIKKLAQKRSREIMRTRKEELNLLRLRQIYLNRKIVLELKTGTEWRVKRSNTNL